MTPEVARRYYLDAMGITAWASRYQLPNALPTEACEWDDTPPEKTPPRDRLQAVLDDAPPPRKEAKPAELSTPSPEASPLSVRALLGQAPPVAEPPVKKEAVSPAPKPTPATSAKPLRFALSCMCIGQRWLSLHPGNITPKEQQLLSNILQAASIQQGELPSIMLFEWPPMANAFEVAEPLEEAREGLSAFIAGSASRKGWKLERVLWWGEHETPHADEVLQVLNVQQTHSQTLALPIWQGPSLAGLIQSPQAKRELWPALNVLGQEWQTLEKDPSSRD